MAKQRLVETALWVDGWFLNLSTEARLFFIFLLTNPLTRESGFFEMPDHLIIPYLYPINKIHKAREELRKKVIYDAKYNLYLILNFYEKNCKSPKMIPSALNDIDRYKDSILVKYFLFKNKHIQQFKEHPLYPIDTLSIGCNDNDNDNDILFINKETINNDKLESNNILSFDFESLYQDYPRKEGKSLGFKKLKTVCKSQLIYEKIKKSIANYRTINQKTERCYILKFSNFMNTWEDYENIDTTISNNSQISMLDPEYDKRTEEIRKREALEEAKNKEVTNG